MVIANLSVTGGKFLSIQFVIQGKCSCKYDRFSLDTFSQDVPCCPDSGGICTLCFFKVSVTSGWMVSFYTHVSGFPDDIYRGGYQIVL